MRNKANARQGLLTGSNTTAAALVMAFVCWLLAACSDEPGKTRRFEVQGYVESPLDEQGRLEIDHEEIPDYMPSMIMRFQVADPAEAKGLQAGDQIRFTYRVDPTRSWIENIQPTGESRTQSSGNELPPESGKPVFLEAGQALPDYAFLDENGDTVRLSDYRGSVVALTFVFTRCPVPEYCPAMMRNFGNVDEILDDSPPLPAPWKLVTISFDPEYDTPEVMQRYGQAFDYDPESWDLLTSRDMAPIEGIAANVGLKFGKRDGSYLHNLRTVVLDTEGRIFHTFTTENWSPEELAATLLAAASVPARSD